MRIAQISDLHIRPAGHLAYGVAETNGMAERAIHALLRMDPLPDHVLITGDLTDCGLEEEYAILKSLLKRLPMPVHILPGNHDRRGGMHAMFTEYCALDAHGRMNQVKDLGVCVLILLDSVVEGASHGAFDAETSAFLEQALAAHRNRPILVALHHPPFTTGISHMDAIMLQDASRFEATVSAHRNIERVLCGHVHRPIQCRFGGTIAQTAPSVAHQVLFDLRVDAPGAFTLEAPSFLLHCLDAQQRIVTHQVQIDRAPGPFPFVLPAELLSH
jgi:3',5'-cyclic-AMP phosphodiesterase